MERLGIKKIDGEYPRVILYNNDKVSLEISFEGNLDLYFVLKGADIDNKVIINETNLRVYAVFNELYESLINCSLPYEIRDKNMLRRTSNYDMLVQNNVIKWSCDDYSVDVGPSFEIAKVNSLKSALSSSKYLRAFSVSGSSRFMPCCSERAECRPPTRRRSARSARRLP